MKAIVIKHFGIPDVFQEANLPIPSITEHQVLIRVAATSVNPVDTKIRQGLVADIAPDFPAVLHGDVAGVVEAVGDRVDRFKIGDEVYGCAGGVKGMGGALAEYMSADANLIAHKPKSLTMVAAAALPLVSITAWEGLIDRAKICSRQKVLVYGGTGGVGHLGIQLAKWAGAKVYATVSNENKAKVARSLGADVTINYQQHGDYRCSEAASLSHPQTPVEKFVAEHTDGEGFEIVFDTVGNNNLQNAFQAAKLNGTVVSTVSLSSQDLTLLHAKGLTLHLVYMLIPMLSNLNRSYYGNILTKLADLVDRGQVRPLIDSHSFTFDDVAAAHAHLESGAAIGKVVLSQSSIAS